MRIYMIIGGVDGVGKFSFIGQSRMTMEWDRTATEEAAE